jgi:hypothetical protein
MWEFLRSAHQWVATSRLVRRVKAALFRNQARRRIAELDNLSVARCQMRILLGLVHQAHATPFGRAHDFRRIRTHDDFRRLVPLRTTAGLWRDYWQAAFPQLAGLTWPGHLRALAVSPAEPRPEGKCLPVSPRLLAAHVAALRTALSLGTLASPDSLPLGDALGYVASGAAGAPVPAAGRDRVPASSWDELIGREVARAFGARFGPAVSVAGPAPEQGRGGPGTGGLTPRCSPDAVTGLIGAAPDLAQYLRRPAGDVRPDPALVLSTSGPFREGRDSLHALLGREDALVLTTFFPPEGPVAAEDPRHGRLRLLPDHDVFFEFVPVSEVGTSRPVRHGAAEVEAGVPYALALTSPAGVWACLTGTRVCFERREPPLLRWLEPGSEAERWWADDETQTGERGPHLTPSPPPPLQPPHPRGEESPGPVSPGKKEASNHRVTEGPEKTKHSHG